MPLEVFNYFAHSIPMIEAHQTLSLLQVADFPNLKPNAREKIIKRLKKMAYPDLMKPRSVTSEELSRILNG